MKDKNLVTASEIGEYVFCKRGWWLHFNGYIKTNNSMYTGTTQHENLAWKVFTYKKFYALGLLLLIVSLGALFLFILYYILK